LSPGSNPRITGEDLESPPVEKEEYKTEITLGGRTYDFKKGGEMEAFVEVVMRDVVGFPKPIRSLKTIAFVAVTFGVAVAVAGAVASAIAQDWLWFARSGAVVVLVGASLLFYDVRTYYARSISALNKLHELLGHMMKGLSGQVRWSDDQRNAFREFAEKAEKDRQQLVNDAIVGGLAAETNDQATKVRYLEYALIAVGTIIWGFGDLIGKFV